MPKKSYFLPILSSLIVGLIIIPVYINVKTNGRSMLLLERFVENGGIVEIFLLMIYAFFTTKWMTQNQKKARKTAWTIFSIVFFSQLFAGLLFCQQCLMTGKLHLPIPAIIFAGPIYRLQIGFMTILFVSTLIISGPAWCSQLCYFGALDSVASSRASTSKVKYNKRLRITLFFSFIAFVLLLRILRMNNFYATILGLLFGTIGLFLIVLLSKKLGTMIHCTYYCPIGFIVNLYSIFYPIKVKINNNCDLCFRCTKECKYYAIRLDKDNNMMKIGFNCTNCGDCLDVCHVNAIKYSFYNKQKTQFRNFWIVLTIVLHTVFLAFARI